MTCSTPSSRAIARRGARVVAGEDRDVEARGAQPPYGLGSAWLQRVGHGQDAASGAVPADEDRRPTLLLERAHGVVQRRSTSRPASASSPRPPTVTRVPSSSACTPRPGTARNAVTGGSTPKRSRPPARSPGRRGARCRPRRRRRGAAPRRGRRQSTPATLIVPLRQRAGLVEHHGGDAPRALEGLDRRDQDAQLRGAADAHHHGGRGGQSQRARAGDDQHGDRGDQAAEGVAGQQPPAQQRRGRDRQHGRHEHPGDPVGEALRVGLAGLRVLHEAHDLRQRRVGPDRGGAHGQHAGGVERRAGDGAAGDLLDGHRLAGEHRLVDRGRAVGHRAVDGDLLAGADAQHVADHDLVDRHHDLGAVAEQPASLAPSSASARRARPASPFARASK